MTLKFFFTVIYLFEFFFLAYFWMNHIYSFVCISSDENDLLKWFDFKFSLNLNSGHGWLLQLLLITHILYIFINWNVLAVNLSRYWRKCKFKRYSQSASLNFRFFNCISFSSINKTTFPENELVSWTLVSSTLSK